MAVLTTAGKAINWSKPPKPTTKVMWSQKTTGGKKVIGSFRTICHLDYLNTLAKRAFGHGIVVIQSSYNKGVKASAGTHDYDACLDVYIPNVPWSAQQDFFRANGAGAYHRKPPAFGHHIHYFTLPPREGSGVNDDFREAGFKVGKYVDGGFSLYGRKTTSSQIEDYYNHRTALAGHAKDPSWFPPNIKATIFNLNSYVKSMKPKPKPKPTPAKPITPKPKPKKKTVNAIAKEVIAGKWGVGDTRTSRLKKAGYNPTAVQRKVNALVNKKPVKAKAPAKPKKAKPKKKSLDVIAREVVAGKWGNGPSRKKRLRAAGYDPAAVQKRVNRLV